MADTIGKTGVGGGIRQPQLSISQRRAGHRCPNEHKKQHRAQKGFHQESPEIDPGQRGLAIGDRSNTLLACVLLLAFSVGNREFLDLMAGLESRGQPARLFAAT